MPYVQVKVPAGTLKLLIDTGASTSILNPDKITNKNLIIKTKAYSVKALNNNTFLDSKVEFRFFKEFGEDRPNVTFYLFNFHEYFDGLIGYDILRENDMEIDLKNNILKRRNYE